MWTLLIILMTLFGLCAAVMTYVAWGFNRKINDLESFIIDFNEDINIFKKSVDTITRANIMVYDELVFDVMSQCQVIKNKLDLYLSKFDEYKNYIYTDDIEKETEEKDVLGVIRPGANQGQ